MPMIVPTDIELDGVEFVVDPDPVPIVDPLSPVGVELDAGLVFVVVRPVGVAETLTGSPAK